MARRSAQDHYPMTDEALEAGDRAVKRVLE
jgi:hypothetical protein